MARLEKSGHQMARLATLLRTEIGAGDEGKAHVRDGCLTLQILFNKALTLE